MLDIYRYHNDPESLLGGVNRWKRGPVEAAYYLLDHPDHKGALELVLTTSRGIITYVQLTNKPFPQGLSKLHDMYDLITYAELSGQRLSPEYEHKLLTFRSQSREHLLLRYVDNVIKGPWKELEPILANSSEADYKTEYVRKWLGGDWSKFHDGSLDATSGWLKRVRSTIEWLVSDINDQGWASEDEDDNFEWTELKVACSPRTDGMNIYLSKEGSRSREKVGEIMKVGGESFACLDGNGVEVARFPISLSSDDMSDELYNYVYDIVVNQ